MEIGFDSLLPEETPTQDASLTLRVPRSANSKVNAGAPPERRAPRGPQSWARRAGQGRGLLGRSALPGLGGWMDGLTDGAGRSLPAKGPGGAGEPRAPPSGGSPGPGDDGEGTCKSLGRHKLAECLGQPRPGARGARERGAAPPSAVGLGRGGGCRMCDGSGVRSVGGRLGPGAPRGKEELPPGGGGGFGGSGRACLHLARPPPLPATPAAVHNSSPDPASSRPLSGHPRGIRPASDVGLGTWRLVFISHFVQRHSFSKSFD